MNTKGRRSAFTLIEVLIVVVIMALLAATIIPQFTNSTKDARKSAMDFNLHTMRSQIEVYKAHHNGSTPTLADFAKQMTQKTNLSGTPGSGAAYIYGPYITGQVPMNPYNNLNTITTSSVTVNATTGALEGTVNNAFGWQYNETDGGFYPSHTGYNYATGETTP